MKKIAVFILLLCLLSNCHDSKFSTTDNRATSFNRNVGDPISTETASRWIDRLKKSSEAAKASSIRRISQTALNQILNPTNEKLGISFHRAIDDAGTYHIILEPVFEGQSVWASAFVLDANTDQLVNTSTAKDWCNKYKTENPNGTWSFFFGTHVFENPFVMIEPLESLNDQNAAALLLYIWREDTNNNGRSNADVLEVFDHGQVCPTNCGTVN